METEESVCPVGVCENGEGWTACFCPEHGEFDAWEGQREVNEAGLERWGMFTSESVETEYYR